MEEASSIAKAIEAAWIRAEKPAEFSVKVLEEPEKNFFGLTSKSAKIAFIFNDEKASHKRKHKQTAYTQTFAETPVYEKQAPKDRHVSQKHEKQPVAKTEMLQEKGRHQKKNIEKQTKQRDVAPQVKKDPIVREKTEPTEKKQKVMWSPDMIDIARSWLSNFLEVIDKKSISFDMDPKRYYLLINFNTPLRTDKQQEQTLFRGASHIIMNVLRARLKKPLRGFKIVLKSEQNSATSE